jgi:DNA polymerase III epsilon subunit-like protein
MIIFDTETTGLPQPSVVPVDQQPHIIEFGAVKLSDTTLIETDRLHFLLNPGVPLEPIITKITGLTDKDLKDEKPFSAYYLKLVRFFLGEEMLVAHNAPFDVALLTFELARIDMVTRFPWPFKQACTVERSTHLTGSYLKLEKLYKELFGRDPNQTHRAMGDVEILVDCVRELRRKGAL